MALAPGTRFGPYEVTALVGVGGMGEVYRAHDTLLGRDVAIKVLPTAFAADPERLARFEREAKTLAALNHSNIAQIYGLEKTESIRALVMELVEGETLAERIVGRGHVRRASPRAPTAGARAGSERFSLRVDEALRIARQIAEALDAAHEKGIVHRDLKPANIMITPEGTVKVLDFGLAKAAAVDVPGASLTQAPTLTLGGTREGVVVGTTAYMSPEQARGQAVDKRTDIWAFGCVLYEMLTGRAAFARATVSDTIAAILEREPQWEHLPADTPPQVVRLLRKCLEKNPRARLRDVGDIELAHVDPPQAGRDAPRLAATPTAWAIVGIALILTGAMALVLLREGTPSVPPIVQFDVSPP